MSQRDASPHGDTPSRRYRCVFGIAKGTDIDQRSGKDLSYVASVSRIVARAVSRTKRASSVIAAAQTRRAFLRLHSRDEGLDDP